MRLGLMKNAGTTNPNINAWEKNSTNCRNKRAYEAAKKQFSIRLMHLPCRIFHFAISTNFSQNSNLIGECLPDMKQKPQHSNPYARS